MSAEWLDEKRLAKRNPFMTVDGISLSSEAAMPLIKEYGLRPKRYGSLDEAMDKPQGCNLFVRTSDRVYGIHVPDERLVGLGVGERRVSPDRAVFEGDYSLVRVPEGAKIKAQVGLFKSDRFDERRLAYWISTLMGFVRQADNGRFDQFSLGKQRAEHLDPILAGAYGVSFVSAMRKIPSAGSAPTDEKALEAYQAFNAADECVNQLLTDVDSIKAVVDNYRRERGFWRGTPVFDNYVPFAVLAAAMSFGKAGGEGSIEGEFDKITGPLKRADIDYIVSTPGPQSLWPKDQRVWSQDFSYCIEPKDFSRPKAETYKTQDYWKKEKVTQGMLNNGGMVLHGFGNTPYLIACNSLPEDAVNGYLEAVRQLPGHELTQAYLIHSGFIRHRLFGQVFDSGYRDFDMNLDTFGVKDTEYGRPGLWVDPIYLKALRGDPGFQRFLREQGDAIEIVESHPDETHLHPQNTSWVKPGLKIVNHCPKSLGKLNPVSDRWLVLDEPVEKLHQFLGGVGCNTGMVWVKRY